MYKELQKLQFIVIQCKTTSSYVHATTTKTQLLFCRISATVTQCTHRIILTVRYRTLLNILQAFFGDYHSIHEHSSGTMFYNFSYIQGDQKVSVHLMITILSCLTTWLNLTAWQLTARARRTLDTH
jgi:hypothetical protein